jgi:diguanylate cyclase
VTDRSTDRSEATTHGEDLEGLARRLLDLVGRLTGLSSTYLTRIRWEQGLQDILYSRNVGSLEIPEGLSVEWSDTLCRRAIEGGPTLTTDVPGTYPDSAAAAELGLTTYVTFPVRGPDGEIFGTLCGADDRAVELHPDVLAVMETVAEMVALQLANEAARRALEQANLTLARLASVDVLTGVANRRALDEELRTALERAMARGVPVAAFAVDIDHFKQVNDSVGHAGGDEVLRRVADRIVDACRGDDVVVRLGGDEFVALLVGTDATGAHAVAERLRADVAEHPVRTPTGGVEVTISVGVAEAATADLDALLASADAALYEAERRGRNTVTGADTAGGG